MPKKLGKRQLKNVGLLFPEKSDILGAEEKFSYAQYIEDLNAFRNNIRQGYFADFPNDDILKIFYDEDYVYEQEIDEEKWQEICEKMGDLDIKDYDIEIKELHQEFVQRVLDGEELAKVDIDISERMEELATRNIDGSHTIELDSKKR